MTHVIYEEEEGSELKLENDSDIPNEDEDNMNFDQEYIAKVLNYKNNLKSSKFVGLIDYRDPCSLR